MAGITVVFSLFISWGSIYIHKELPRVFGTNIFCFKINTSCLVRISNSIDGFVAENPLVVSLRCFKVCSALTVADVTVA